MSAVHPITGVSVKDALKFAENNPGKSFKDAGALSPVRKTIKIDVGKLSDDILSPRELAKRKQSIPIIDYPTPLISMIDPPILPYNKQLSVRSDISDVTDKINNDIKTTQLKESSPKIDILEKESPPEKENSQTFANTQDQDIPYGKKYDRKNYAYAKNVRIKVVVCIKQPNGLYRKTGAEPPENLTKPEEFNPDEDQDDLFGYTEQDQLRFLNKIIKQIYDSNPNIKEDSYINKYMEVMKKAKTVQEKLNYAKRYLSYLKNLLSYTDKKMLVSMGIEGLYLGVSFVMEHLIDIPLQNHFNSMKTNVNFYSEALLTRPEISHLVRKLTKGTNPHVEPISPWYFLVTITIQFIGLITVAYLQKAGWSLPIIVAGTAITETVKDAADSYMFKGKPLLANLSHLLGAIQGYISKDVQPDISTMKDKKPISDDSDDDE